MSELTMKAITQTGYGPLDTLKLEEVARPTPAADEVLVAVFASSVNFANVALVEGKPWVGRLWSGLFSPKDRIPGGDFSGRIEAVGAGVTKFQVGDLVFGDVSDCGFGAFAEYVCAPERVIAKMPASLTFEEAAALPQAALVALQGLQGKAGIEAGEKVLIVGASGGNGTFAVQIAKALGAHVTAVCSARNVNMVRSLGADHVIDYTQTDFAEQRERYDVIVAMAGSRSIFAYQRVLRRGGRYVVTGGSMRQIFEGLLVGPLLSLVSGKKLGNLMQQASVEDLVLMTELVETGKVRPVIDRSFALEEAVDALRYYAEGHSRGKVVITVSSRQSLASA